jgi:hypothetical protein
MKLMRQTAEGTRKHYKWYQDILYELKTKYDLSEVLNYRKKLLFHINRIQRDKFTKLMKEYKPINWNKKPRMTIGKYC